jgi:hypothetical protein
LRLARSWRPASLRDLGAHRLYMIALDVDLLAAEGDFRRARRTPRLAFSSPPAALLGLPQLQPSLRQSGPQSQSKIQHLRPAPSPPESPLPRRRVAARARRREGLAVLEGLGDSAAGLLDRRRATRRGQRYQGERHGLIGRRCALVSANWSDSSRPHAADRPRMHRVAPARWARSRRARATAISASNCTVCM